MGLFATLKRPAVRIPLVTVVIAGCSLWAFRSCEQKARTLRLLNARRVSFIELLATAVETEEHIEILGKLVQPEEKETLSLVQKVFLRDFAERREFRELADPEAEPLSRLGVIRVWSSPKHELHARVILWSGELQPPVLFRLSRNPENKKEFIIFSWPQDAGKAQLTLAWLSTEPERIYYTSAPRYVGPEAGPVIKDLGAAPFAGKMNLLIPEAGGDSYDEFLRKAEAEDGKVWAWRNVNELTDVPE